MSVRSSDLLQHRKARGAFFTPPAIADFLADWAVRSDPHAHVLDPTCGEGVFVRAAGRRLRHLGLPASELDQHLFGVDLFKASLTETMSMLEGEGLDARLIHKDFFEIPAPQQLGCTLPEMDAVIGNPPFIRYQEHIGQARKKSIAAALAQGVRLSGLASSWAALLVHACAFLKPEGRLAMVLPAELLSVHYAEPVRRWLRQRFASVHLVMFEHLQFDDALEKVVLVVAQGSGGSDAFSLVYVENAEDLPKLHVFDTYPVTPADKGKWTDLLLSLRQRQLFRHVVDGNFVTLGKYGTPELGTVTGANDFFAISESTRREYGLTEQQLTRISPPGTRHLRGLAFTEGDWRKLRDADEPVWLVYPDPNDRTKSLREYVAAGEARNVHQAYKCQIRDPWWRPPVVPSPDLFFTYMSHRYPKLITNTGRVTLLNSMHGIRLRPDVPKVARAALPLLALNSVTMLGAEIYGRSYGGGVLKMEPREAAVLPVPDPEKLTAAWNEIKGERDRLDRQLRKGEWTNVAKRVDEVLLEHAMGLGDAQVAELHEAVRSLRERRIRTKNPM